VHWSPKGDFLCVKSTSGELVVVDAATLEITSRLQTERAGEGCEAVYSPHGDRLLDGTWGGMLATYDVASQIRQLEHLFPHAMITRIVPSRSHARVAVVVQPTSYAGLPPGPQHSICFGEWSQSGLSLRTIPAKFQKIQDTAFDSSEKHLAILRRHGDFPEGRIEIIDVEQGQTIASRTCVLSPNGGSICWSPNGGVIGTAENDGFRFYDPTDLKETASVPLKSACHVEFSGNGKHLALGAWSGGEIRSADSVLSQIGG
jgi:WD40 repeat protein